MRPDHKMEPLMGRDLVTKAESCLIAPHTSHLTTFSSSPFSSPCLVLNSRVNKQPVSLNVFSQKQSPNSSEKTFGLCGFVICSRTPSSARNIAKNSHPSEWCWGMLQYQKFQLVLFLRPIMKLVKKKKKKNESTMWKFSWEKWMARNPSFKRNS